MDDRAVELANALMLVKKECAKHEDIDSCSDCILCQELPGVSRHESCILDWPPTMWPAFPELYQLMTLEVNI